jgi:hypothetical protein
MSTINVSNLKNPSSGINNIVLAADGSTVIAAFSAYSGNTAPAVTVAFQDWIDTSGTDPIWKKRNAANDAWITVATITGASSLLVDTAALATGIADNTTFLRGDQTWQSILGIASTAQAEAGADDTTAISPLKLRQGFNATGTAPVFACRAWVNFNGTGTVAIRASGNVTSITDNGTGDYTVNFATAMVDANYSVSMTGKSSDSTSSRIAGLGATGTADPTSSGFRFIFVKAGDASAIDGTYCCVCIFR